MRAADGSFRKLCAAEACQYVNYCLRPRRANLLENLSPAVSPPSSAAPPFLSARPSRICDLWQILSQALRGGGLPICKLLPAPPPCKSSRKSLVRSLAPVFRRAAFFVTARPLRICDLWRILSQALRGGGLPICKLLPAPPPSQLPRKSLVRSRAPVFRLAAISKLIRGVLRRDENSFGASLYSH